MERFERIDGDTEMRTASSRKRLSLRRRHNVRYKETEENSVLPLYTALMGSDEDQTSPASRINPTIYKILINYPGRYLNTITGIGIFINGMTKAANSTAR